MKPRLTKPPTIMSREQIVLAADRCFITISPSPWFVPMFGDAAIECDGKALSKARYLQIIASDQRLKQSGLEARA